MYVVDWVDELALYGMGSGMSSLVISTKGSSSIAIESRGGGASKRIWRCFLKARLEARSCLVCTRRNDQTSNGMYVGWLTSVGMSVMNLFVTSSSLRKVANCVCRLVTSACKKASRPSRITLSVAANIVCSLLLRASVRCIGIVAGHI